MTDSPEGLVIDCEALLLLAMRTSDADLLDELLHDDLLFNGPDGSTVTKAQDLANYRSGGIALKIVEGRDMRTSVIDGDVVVAVTLRLMGNYMGKPLDGSARYLRVWKRLGGRYQVIAGSVVPV